MIKKVFSFAFLSFLMLSSLAYAGITPRTKYNFNPDWLLHIGDDVKASEADYDDTQWEAVCLPHAFNEDEAFARDIAKLTDTVVWYRKHFKIPSEHKGQKVFIEFEGVRQAAEVWINGQKVGRHENGVMAFGLDLSEHVYIGNKENIIALRIDNDWSYREKESNSRYQWNDRNFNANYGGLPKNVILHCTNKLYQTLPLYSHLQTTGVYTYADQIDIRNKSLTLHVASEVRNEYDKPQTFHLNVMVRDNENNMIREFSSEEITLQPNEMRVVSCASVLNKVKFWSWGYGYLYQITTSLVNGKKTLDLVRTTTGFRKTEFKNGMFYLNGRVLMLKGYAQRTSNEWPGVGMSIPAWLSDYSNGLIEKGNGNFIRWMHVTPWKQDIESCDRVGLIQVMPAGDSEKDAQGRQWEQRLELMRDAIIYNRNNPSIIFYECGNESISEEHMAEMKAIRDQYDPYGGRAIGSREMLDSKVAEYGGEMLYINKSAQKPMFATEYCRDEALRKYWDNYSYPYHKDGDGPLYRDKPAKEYNRNQDSYALEIIRRWYDYWLCRPGTGRRVSAGAANIIFSDTNTHFRGAENYRRSGEVDAMRIPKDAYFAHKVMWGGWSDIENRYYATHIIGHWNYQPGTVKDIYVVSNADKVELFVNGKNMGFGERSYQFLFTFKDIAYQPGSIKAIAYDANGKEAGEAAEIKTAGVPAAVRLSLMQSPDGLKADGADMALIEVQVVDQNGLRCPLADNLIHFDVEGPADFRGGIGVGNDSNFVLSKHLPVECGINRVLVRSLRQAGSICLSASAKGLKPDTIRFESTEVPVKNGLGTYFQKEHLSSSLWRGATPSYPSFTMSKVPVSIRSAEAGIYPNDVRNSFDDNELSEWRNDGRLSTAWIEYRLSRPAILTEASLKLAGWRNRSYHLQILSDNGTILWEGETERSLGYIHLPLQEAAATQHVRIQAIGENKQTSDFSGIVELAGEQGKDSAKASKDDSKGDLRIIEVEFYTQTIGL